MCRIGKKNIVTFSVFLGEKDQNKSNVFFLCFSTQTHSGGRSRRQLSADQYTTLLQEITQKQVCKGTTCRFGGKFTIHLYSRDEHVVLSD